MTKHRAFTAREARCAEQHAGLIIKVATKPALQVEGGHRKRSVMSRRKYPLAQAILKRRKNPWEELSLKLTELGDDQHALLELSHGVLAGLQIEIGAEAITIKRATSVQERLLARRVDALARRLGRRAVFA